MIHDEIVTYEVAKLAKEKGFNEECRDFYCNDKRQKLNELERLKTEQKLIRSKGITPEILAEEFIQKWDGKTPLYKTVPEIIKMQ